MCSEEGNTGFLQERIFKTRPQITSADTILRKLPSTGKISN